jgi:hypothetical protein
VEPAHGSTVGRTSLVALAACALVTARPAAAACGPDEPPGRREKVWLVPAVEVIAFDAGLWAVDRYALDADYSHVSWGSVGRNLRGPWIHDDDDFNTNQLLHPWHGANNFTAARSAGHGFWTSAAFAAGGALAWELAGETQAPSFNDLVMSSWGGTVLGETLFRVSRLVLDRKSRPGVVRRVGAFVLAPAAGLNDALLGGVICDPDPPVPPYRARLSFGGAAGVADALEGRVSIPASARLGFTMDYGLAADIDPHAPFDHFRMSFQYLSGGGAPWNALDSVRGPAWLLSIDGLLAGGSTPTGGGGRTLYGLFGTFDFGGPVLLRVSEAGIGPGVSVGTGPGTVRAEATLLAAATFGSAGGRTPLVNERDYQHALGSLVVARGRLALGERAALEAGVRAFFVPQAIGGGSEQVAVGEAALVVRLVGPHAIAVEALRAERQASYLKSVYAERTSILGLSYAVLIDRP